MVESYTQLGKFYISAVLDSESHCNNSRKRLDWNSTFNSLENTICTLRELIDIINGYKECNGLINNDLDKFILSIYTD